MEHSRYLAIVDYQQRIDPNKLFILRVKIKDAAEYGEKGVELFIKFTKAEISYLALYGYRVIQDNSHTTLTEVVWN